MRITRCIAVAAATLAVLVAPTAAQAHVPLGKWEAKRQAVRYLKQASPNHARVFQCYILSGHHVRLCDFILILENELQCDGGVQVRKAHGSYHMRVLQGECYR